MKIRDIISFKVRKISAEIFEFKRQNLVAMFKFKDERMKYFKLKDEASELFIKVQILKIIGYKDLQTIIFNDLFNEETKKKFLNHCHKKRCKSLVKKQLRKLKREERDIKYMLNKQVEEIKEFIKERNKKLSERTK